MSEKFVKFREIATAPCPFGGPGTILYKIDDEGDIVGKCTLASAVRAQYCTHYDDVKSTEAEMERKKAGCPKPVYHSFYSSERNCPYVSGLWIKIKE